MVNDVLYNKKSIIEKCLIRVFRGECSSQLHYPLVIRFIIIWRSHFIHLKVLILLHMVGFQYILGIYSIDYILPQY